MVKSAVVKEIASLRSFGLYTLKFQFLHKYVEALESLGSISSTHARPLEEFEVLITQWYKMRSWQSPTRVQGTVRVMGSTMQNVQRAREGGEVTQCEEMLLKKKRLLERPGDLFCGTGSGCQWKSWWDLSKADERHCQRRALMVGCWLSFQYRGR